MTQTKVCKKCNKELEATLEFWHKQKNGKYGVRSICKICSLKEQKEYRERPENKEAHRINAAKWREKNRGRVLEINRRCYKKNADRFNAIRRDRYQTDQEYREKRREYDRKYSESGRRYEVNSKPEMREKARIRAKKRRQNPEKKQLDYNRAAIWRDENREYLKELDDKRRKKLCPSYVAYSMRVSVKDLTPEVLETKKLIIKLKRELKNNNVKIR